MSYSDTNNAINAGTGPFIFSDFSSLIHKSVCMRAKSSSSHGLVETALLKPGLCDALTMNLTKAAL